MSRYHFNKDTGRTGKCEAKIKCRLGLAESEHFGTREEAQAAFEKSMSGKGSASVVKKNSRMKNIDTVRFDVTDKYPYDQDQNLNGRTVAEYRKFVLDSVEEYDGRKKEITDAIIEQIGVSALKSDWSGYNNVRILNKGEVQIIHHLNDNAFELPLGDTYEGYEYSQEVMDNLNPEELIDEDFVTNEHFKEVKPFVDGYYNEVQQLILTYNIPEEQQKDAEGVLNAEKYKKIAHIANNPAFPDWAVVPANVTLDQDVKTFDNLDTLARPTYPSNKINAIDRKLNPQGERERLTKSLENNRKQREEWANKLKKVNEAKTKHNTTSSRNDYVNLETKVEPENLTLKQRTRLAEKIEMRISHLENTAAKNEEKLKNIKDNLSEKELAGLLANKTKMQEKYEDSLRQYTIDKLSRHYPRSDENIRKREAAKWVDTHPDILKVADY